MPLASAQASRSRIVKQQHECQHSSAFLQPQGRFMQGNGLLRSFFVASPTAAATAGSGNPLAITSWLTINSAATKPRRERRPIASLGGQSRIAKAEPFRSPFERCYSNLPGIRRSTRGKRTEAGKRRIFDAGLRAVFRGLVRIEPPRTARRLTPPPGASSMEQRHRPVRHDILSSATYTP